MLILDSFAFIFLFFLFVAIDKLGTLVVRASGILIGLIRLLCDAALLAAFVYGIFNQTGLHALLYLDEASLPYVYSIWK